MIDIAYSIVFKASRKAADQIDKLIERTVVEIEKVHGRDQMAVTVHVLSVIHNRTLEPTKHLGNARNKLDECLGRLYRTISKWQATAALEDHRFRGVGGSHDSQETINDDDDCI